MHALAAFIGTATLWIAWSGHYTALMLCFGVISCLLVAWLSRQAPTRSPLFGPLLWHLPRYLVWLFREIVSANITVVRSVWWPQKYPYQPDMQWIPASQETEFGLALHANTITKTPGTLAVEVAPGRILVHALDGNSLAELQHDSDFDRRCKALEQYYHV